MEPADAPGHPRTESAMMASPKKVMARTMPANRVMMTKAAPTAASGSADGQEGQNSDHVRLVNGSRR
jgi:hypothetical protein